MALLRGGMFVGALFVGALFGISTPVTNVEASRIVDEAVFFQQSYPEFVQFVERRNASIPFGQLAEHGTSFSQQQEAVVYVGEGVTFVETFQQVLNAGVQTRETVNSSAVVSSGSQSHSVLSRDMHTLEVVVGFTTQTTVLSVTVQFTNYQGGSYV